MVTCFNFGRPVILDPMLTRFGETASKDGCHKFLISLSALAVLHIKMWSLIPLCKLALYWPIECSQNDILGLLRLGHKAFV